MINNAISVRGFVHLIKYDKNMNVVEDLHFENLVVQTGLNWIAGRLNNPTPNVMNFIAVGTGNDNPTLTQTTLVSELWRGAVSVSGGSVSNNNLVFSINIPPGQATGGLVEAGIFDSDPGGTMLSRVTYPVVNKGDTDTIAITWTITIG